MIIPLRLFRALKREIPDKETRLAILRAKSGVVGLFVWKPALGRFEVNSVEYTIRKMEVT